MNHTIPLEQDRLSDAIQACVWGVEQGGKAISLVDIDDSRSGKQTRLSFVLYKHINKIGKMTNAREYCKYKFGVPILIVDENMYRRFKTVFTHLSFEQRLDAIEIVPVTSLMKVKQMAEYLTNIYNHFDPLGYNLPKPEDLYYESLGYKR